MYLCKNCGQQYPQYIKFCGKCGGEVADSGQPQQYPNSQQNYQNQGNMYEQTMQTTVPSYETQENPAYQPMTYANSETTPAPAGSSKAKGIIGMILGIESIIGSLIFFMLSLVSIGISVEAVDDYYDYYYDYYSYSYYDPRDGACSFATFIIFVAIVHLAFAIIGMCLSSSARNNGFVSGATKAGKILSIIALVFSAIATVFGFISLIIASGF